MTYGVFNLATGNLIDSVDSGTEALELVSSLLEDHDADPEMIGLSVVDDAGRTVVTLHGRSLTDASP